MNTLTTIKKEIEFLSDIATLACDYPELVKRGSYNYFGEPTDDLVLTDEAQARLDELNHYLDLYDSGLDYEELCLLYNLGSESLLPTMSGMFDTGHKIVNQIIKAI